MMFRFKMLPACWASLACTISVVADDSVTRIRSGHNLLQENAAQTTVAPGESIGSLAFKSVEGEAFYLNEAVEKGPAVFVFLSTECPLAKRYTMRLRRLHERYANQGVRLFAIFPNSNESDQGIKEYAQKAAFSFPCLRDLHGYLVSRFGATMTPQVFVVDSESRLRYRGAIDDHRYENRVKTKYLQEVIDSLLAGTEIETPVTKSMGCSIHLSQSDDSDSEITYSGHIARILQDNCQACHRSGQVAPFALEDYEDAVTWKTEIQAYTHSRLMPPWKASPAVGDFANEMSLSEDEIQLIARWVQGGAPQGDPAEMPPPPKFSDDWAFGEPDLVVGMPQEYVVGPEGEDDYRHFVIPYRAGEHRFVEAIDVQPGNRNVVHHVIAYVDTSGRARELDAEDEAPGYTRFGDVGFKPVSVIGGWAPGNLPSKTPAGSGRWLPKECDIVLQVHYYRSGIEERDRTKIGIYFSTAPRPVPTRIEAAIDRKFVVPAGEPKYEVRAHCDIKESSYLFAITPHMHLIGRTMSVTAVLPDKNKTELPLIRIDDWDFNWQITYRYRQLQYLPKGTRVELVATFDNSPENPNNPNHPPKDVGWGEKTTDEMCIAFLGLLHESEYDPDVRGRRLPASDTVAVTPGGK